MVQHLVALFMHLHKPAKRGRLAVFWQRHKVVYKREQAHQGKNTYALLHGTSLAQFNHYTEYKFCPNECSEIHAVNLPDVLEHI